MRHQYFGKKLNRDIKERKALFKSLIIALITHGKIHTTLAKAKAVRKLVEKIVSRAKEGSDYAVHQLSSFLGSRAVIKKLNDVITPRFKNTPGGYVRMRRIGKRRGDMAEEVVLEWSIDEKKESKSVEESKKKGPQVMKENPKHKTDKGKTNKKTIV